MPQTLPKQPEIATEGGDLSDHLTGDLLAEADGRLRQLVSKAEHRGGLYTQTLLDPQYEAYAYSLGSAVSYGVNGPQGCLWRAKKEWR